MRGRTRRKTVRSDECIAWRSQINGLVVGARNAVESGRGTPNQVKGRGRAEERFVVFVQLVKPVESKHQVKCRKATIKRLAIGVRYKTGQQLTKPGVVGSL